ncbi:MAG: FIG021250: possible hydrolase [uncultured Acidimicrobiales bacterium]|uniref:FIG021250: possible hydrolase n=1 Tax=uncultured Acidimicrobiales bacterium TaxID=310071 RepID=A0A6J4IB61_9ACTN|nr:MAG: FIG021250: possible hydrolase [uncultured Acidimicrobiales bacterium]
MADPVAWDLAEKVAVRVAGREPLAESYHLASLERDIAELTPEAEALVAEVTGLPSLAGPARARVTDRAGWIHANVASFQRLLRPVLEKLAPRMGASAFAPVTARVAGVQLGTMLGWMSTRVLGQYDLLLIEDERPDEQDIVYFVGPNVLALERRFGFPPREFRLWLALHEVTHRAQFTGVPWMRSHFLSLVESTLQGIDPDPKRFLEALRRSADQVRAGQNPLDDGGLVALLAGPAQYESLQRVSGLMSLLEGHGDVTMNRAGRGRVPSADRFHRTLHDRRGSATGAAKVLQKLIGLEAKMKQYQQGEQFIEAVERVGGTALIDRVWEGPEMLPDLSEIRDPDRWVARVRSGAEVVR